MDSHTRDESDGLTHADEGRGGNGSSVNASASDTLQGWSTDWMSASVTLESWNAASPKQDTLGYLQPSE